MMTKHKRGEARREQILDAAEMLFRQQGYSATSMRQIADAAGYGSSVSGLYNHYASKEAIFEALLISRSPYEDVLEALQAVEGATFREFLRSWFDRLWPIMETHMPFVQLVLIDIQEFEGRTLANFLSTFLPEYFKVFSQIQAMPDVRQDLPLPVLVRTVASVMIGYLFTEMIARNSLYDDRPIPIVDIGDWLDGLVDILARGMSHKENLQ
jgi:AcrR family transcriptional regulator